MIVSHSPRYLFIQIPQTGSTAIGRELIEQYGGGSVLYKHSSFTEFRRLVGKSKASEYFVFASVRNPLEIAVSKYLKARTDHQNAFSSAPSDPQGSYVARNPRTQAEYQYITDNDASFEQYFQRFYRFVYNSRCALLPKNLDHLIRYEQIDEGFAAVLQEIGLKQVRDLPIRNRTKRPKKELADYYTPAIRSLAVKVFGPYMKKWGYSFPAGWPTTDIAPARSLLFRFDGFLRPLYYNEIQSRRLDRVRRRAQSSERIREDQVERP